jgi:glutathione S-transferase
MKLFYHSLSSNSRKVRIVQSILGAPMEGISVDMLSGDHRGAEYMDVNPNGLLPTLEDDGFVLWESNAICQHLASKVETPLWPEDARSRADIARWQFWEASHWMPAIRVLVVENMFKERLGLGAPDPLVLQQGEATFRRFAAVLDAQLARRDYLVGEQLTLADISAAVHLMYAEPAKLPLADLPGIATWIARIEALPQWAETSPGDLD